MPLCWSHCSSMCLAAIVASSSHGAAVKTNLPRHLLVANGSAHSSVTGSASPQRRHALILPLLKYVNVCVLHDRKNVTLEINAMEYPAVAPQVRITGLKGAQCCSGSFEAGHHFFENNRSFAIWSNKCAAADGKTLTLRTDSLFDCAKVDREPLQLP